MTTFDEAELRVEARVARQRERDAQLAESFMRDEIKRAIDVLDDMRLDQSERELRVRQILASAAKSRGQ